MTLTVGNLLTDPAAQSFISLADAMEYLEVEAAGADIGTPIADWLTQDSATQEASLVRASRWLAGNYAWHPLDDVALARVGRVAARLAVETVGRNIFGGTDAASVVASESKSVGSVSKSVTYRGSVRSDAAGLSLPWLKLALHGLVRGNTGWLMRG